MFAQDQKAVIGVGLEFGPMPIGPPQLLVGKTPQSYFKYQRYN